MKIRQKKQRIRWGLYKVSGTYRDKVYICINKKYVENNEVSEYFRIKLLTGDVKEGEDWKPYIGAVPSGFVLILFT